MREEGGDIWQRLPTSFCQLLSQHILAVLLSLLIDSLRKPERANDQNKT